MEIRNNFKHKYIIQFTATPFRSDGKPIPGKIVYNYPLNLAQQNGYFKKIDFYPLRIYTHEDLTLAQKGLELLRQDLDKGYDHILMARCGSIDQAKKIYKIYQENANDLHPVLTYSSMSELAINEEKNKLKKNSHGYWFV